MNFVSHCINMLGPGQNFRDIHAQEFEAAHSSLKID